MNSNLINKFETRKLRKFPIFKIPRKLEEEF